MNFTNTKSKMSSLVAGSSRTPTSHEILIETLDMFNSSSTTLDFYNASTSYMSPSPTTSPPASGDNDYVLIIIIVLVLIVALLIYLSAITGCTKVFKDDGVPRPRSMLFGRQISRAISRQMSSQQPKRVGECAGNYNIVEFLAKILGNS